MKKIFVLFAAAMISMSCLAQHVKSIPGATTGDDILTSITKQYKGKVAVIDFWATWCGPCRMAMKTIDEIKPDLMKKGVKFVYITGETSPKDTWTKMIKTIKGDHFRLTTPQWEVLGSKLSMRGIPAYMIIDKNGNVSYSNTAQAGYPGNATISSEVEKALLAK